MSCDASVIWLPQKNNVFFFASTFSFWVYVSLKLFDLLTLSTSMVAFSVARMEVLICVLVFVYHYSFVCRVLSSGLAVIIELDSKGTGIFYKKRDTVQVFLQHVFLLMSNLVE